MSNLKHSIWCPGIRRQDPLAKGLVGYWPMWEGAGSRVMDLAGGNQGTTSNVTWEMGPHGPITTYNGSTSYIAGGSCIALEAGSICMRLRSTDTSWNPQYGFMLQGADATVFGVTIPDAAAQKFRGQFQFVSVVATAGYVAGQWYDVAVTYDGSALKLYIDGLWNNQTVDTKRTMPVSTMTIGNWAAYSTALQGSIEYVSLYDRALSPAEVKSLYQDPYRLITPRKMFPVSVAAPAGVAVPALLEGGMFAGGFQTIGGGF